MVKTKVQMYTLAGEPCPDPVEYKNLHVQRIPLVGCKNILRANQSFHFQNFVQFGTLIAYVAVSVDFVWALTVRVDNSTLWIQPFVTGTFSNFLFCYDFIFMLYLFIDMKLKHRDNLKLYNISAAISSISLVPFEFFYSTVAGTNMTIYYGLRLRYLLRLVQFLFHFVNVFSESTTSTSSVIVSIVKFCIMGLTACHTVSLYTLYYDCQFSAFTVHNCTSLKAGDFITAFSAHSGLMSQANWIQVTYSNFLTLAVFQYLMYLVTFQMFSNVICTLISDNYLQYEFAIQSSMVLKKLRIIKQNKAAWTVKDHMHEMFVRQHLKFLWEHWEKLYPEIMEQNVSISKMPSIMTSEILFDVSWNMFKHSVLFQGESVHFLRYISSLTKCVILTEGEPIIKLDNPNSSMIYIISGTVDIMSEYNLESPILSVTSGAVLGEISLFITQYPQTNVVCRNLCECIILTRTNFLDCKKKYPEVYEKLRKTALSRIETARKYFEINKVFHNYKYTKMEKWRSSLRYIKRITRKYTQGHNSNLAIANMLSSLRLLEETYEIEKTVYCPHYLSMYSIMDMDRIDTNNHFLKTGWFFKINPDSPLLKIYNLFIYSIVLMHTLVGPLWFADDSTIDSDFFSIYMYTISILWIFDFLLYGYIGCKHQGRVYTDFENIFDHVTTNWRFWMDAIAMLPIEHVWWVIEGPFNTKHFRYFQLNRFLKGYKLIDFINSAQFSMSKHMVVMMMMKILLTHYCLLTLGHYIFMQSGYYDLIDDRYKVDRTYWRLMLVGMYFQSQVPFRINTAEGTSMTAIIFLQVIVYIWKVYYKPQMCVSFNLHLSPYIEYENIVDGIKRTFVLNKFEPMIIKKINKYLSLHYQIDHGSEFLRIKRMKKFLGNTLYKTQHIMSFEDLFMEEPLFHDLPYEIVRDLASTAGLMLIPKGEILVSAGALPKEMYFIVEGTCAYVTSGDVHHKIVKRLDKGSSVLVLEVLSKVKVVHNVMTLTDCKVLNVPYQHWEHKLLNYPQQNKLIKRVLKETVNRERMLLMQNKEIVYVEDIGIDEKSSFKKFKKGEKTYLSGFGKKQILRFLLLRTTINPRGRFWIYWEILQVIFSYFSAYMSTVPLFTLKTSESPIFWMLRIFDVVALVDIYLRHHVFYYDQNNIEVSHPWKTATHYWTSSFVIDLIGSFPFELLLATQNSASLLSMYRINRVLKLYRAIGLKSFINEYYLSEIHSLQILYYLLIILLVISYMPYTIMLSECVIFNEEEEMECLGLPRQGFHFLHLKQLHNAVKFFFNFGVFNSLELQTITWDLWLINHMGFVTSLFMTSRIMAMGLSRNSFLTTFQLKMRSLVTFMTMRKIDKKLKSEIIRHYEYLWFLWEGKTIKETFNCFNLACYEEVMYSQLKSTLHMSVVFQPFPKVVMKDFLSSEDLKREMILIKGIIIRVNDIQNKIYILSKGTVEVVGPDLTRLESLKVGSVFGCLDDIQYHRSTLTYVALTHCELLSIPSFQFYNLIRKYSNLYNHFNHLVKSSNIDYIVTHDLSESQAHKRGIYKFTPETRKRKKINPFRKIISVLFGIRKPRPFTTWLMAVLPLFNFIVECYQKIVMSFHWTAIALCYTCDALFVLHIYHRLRESYEDDYGLWIKRRKLIAKRYLKNPWGLIFHIICIFPLEIISLFFTKSEYFFVYWSYLRLNRVLQIIIILKFLTLLTNRLKVNVFAVRMCRILLSIFFLQHICMLVLGNYRIITRQTFSDNIQRYFQLFSVTSYIYTSGIMFIGKKNMNLSTAMYIYNSIMLLGMRVFITCMMADFLASYQVSNYGKFIQETFLIRLRSDLQRKHISQPLCKRLIKYFHQATFGYKSVQFPEFIADAPYYLREGVLNSMFGFLLRRHPIFKQCHVDLIRQISANFETRYFYADDFITFIGDIDECMYFIYSGEVNCLTADTLQYETVAKTYKAGESFGFTQLFHKNTGHKYTYKVAQDCLLLTLHRKKVLHLFTFFPASKHIVNNYNSYLSGKATVA